MIHLGFWGSLFALIFYFGWRHESKETQRKLDEIYKATVEDSEDDSEGDDGEGGYQPDGRFWQLFAEFCDANRANRERAGERHQLTRHWFTGVSPRQDALEKQVTGPPKWRIAGDSIDETPALRFVTSKSDRFRQAIERNLR